MIRAGIIAGIMLGPWKGPDDIKMTADAYITVLRESTSNLG